MNQEARQFQDPAMQHYFNSLSHAVQECIIQSGASPDTLDQLQSLARHFTGSHEPGVDAYGNFRV